MAKPAKNVKRSMWVGLSTLLVMPLLGIFAAVGRPALDHVMSENSSALVGAVLAILVLAYVIYAIVVNIRTFRTGDRSAQMWLGFIPAVFIGGMFVIMAIADLFTSD
ncbi:MAG: hypothetical protein WCI57_00520 [Candidatus Berkelbacteria bacterium]